MHMSVILLSMHKASSSMRMRPLSGPALLHEYSVVT